MKPLVTLLSICFGLSCFGQAQLTPILPEDLKGHVEVHTYSRKSEASNLIQLTATYRAARENFQPIKSGKGKYYIFSSIAELFDFMENQGFDFVTILPSEYRDSVLSLKGNAQGSFLFRKK